MARYRYTSEWLVEAPVERTWDALLLVGEWPTWWRGFRSVERLGAGDEHGLGMRVRQQWRGPLPLTTTINLEIERVERHRLLAGRATGDMLGTCSWAFEAAGDRTKVGFAIDVRPASWWMNLPLPLAGRVFAWNVGTIMRWGSRGLAGLLGAPVIDRTRQLRPAGA